VLAILKKREEQLKLCKKFKLIFKYIFYVLQHCVLWINGKLKNLTGASCPMSSRQEEKKKF